MKGEGFIGKRVFLAEEYFYVIFRVIIGFLYFMHGTAKVFGWWWGKPALTGFMMYVGIFETIAGLLILLGLLTRIGAVIGMIIMISAWLKVHIPMGWNPFTNGGELALLFFAAFIILLVHGSGKFGLEHLMRKKEYI